MGVIRSLFRQIPPETPKVISSWVKMSSETIRREYCAKYPIIIISDALAYVPLVLEEFANHSFCKDNWLILNITNRFDVALKMNRSIYLNLMKKLAQNPRVIWAPNNPFELEWLEMAGVQYPRERTFVCLPVGHSVHVPKESWPVEVKSKLKRLMALQTRTTFWRFGASKHLDRFPAFRERTWTFEEKYGGASALKEKFAWFCYIPYQFSTMKVFEMIREGPMVLVPAPELFKELINEVGVRSSEYAASQMLDCINKRHPSDWEKFFDVYYPGYNDLTVKFHTWEQLKGWIQEGKISGLHLEEHEKKKQERLKIHEYDQLRAWKKVFSIILN